MDNLNLKKLLIAEAREKGICSQGLSIMEDSNINQLVDYYKQTIDWSLERSFPSFKTLVNYFSDRESQGIYINKVFNGDIFSSQPVYVFHNCKGTISIEMDYDNAIIPMLYFDNNCELTVTCNQKRNRFIPIEVPIYVAESKVIPVKSKYAVFKVFKVNRI